MQEKEMWFKFFEEELEDCLGLGLSYEEAEREATSIAHDKVIDFYSTVYDLHKDQRKELPFEVKV